MKGMLSCTKLLEVVRSSFSQVKDTAIRKCVMGLTDCLMSGYAVFSLKYPSLLQFDQHYREEVIRRNLKSVYQVNKAPSDTQMRERLDEVDPRRLRRVFKRLFAQCQRSKRLELFEYYDGRYLLPLDGTGYFFSKDVHFL